VNHSFILQNNEAKVRGKCGSVAMQYQQVRRHGKEQFFTRMSARLQGYEIVIEELENYIWMHRVGDHIEKHYSNLRADALAGE